MTADCLALENVVGDNAEIFDERKNSPQGVLLALRHLSEAGSAITAALKINSIKPKLFNHRAVFVKERHVHGKQLAELANLYFRVWNIPIRFWKNTREWRDWEIKWFKMLNSDRFQIVASGTRAIIEEKVPGQSLWDHMMRGTLTSRMLEAAGRELHRAHQFWSDELNGPWSHGDATATNVIYDETSDQARLIDFETHHDTSIPPVARHADDLLTLLLDLVGHVSSQQWLEMAIPFLKTYQDRTVIAQLRKQLVHPQGLAWIWWEVRTGFTKPGKIKRRLESLRRAIIQEDLCQPVPGQGEKESYPIGHRTPELAFLTPALATA